MNNFEVVRILNKMIANTSHLKVYTKLCYAKDKVNNRQKWSLMP